MTPPTDEELDALDAKLASQIGDDVQTIFDHDQLFKQARSAIAALRTQLAEVQADLTFMTEDRNKWQDSATDRYFRIEEANARADRAEQRVAALEAAPVTMAEAAKDVLAERQRQISTEGWTPEHDDTHINGEMTQAAACYALNAAGWKTEALRGCWPMTWASAWFKPTDQRRNLVKAGALILAEIERLDRAALRAIGESSNESA